jgi:hypothetical protein
MSSRSLVSCLRQVHLAATAACLLAISACACRAVADDDSPAPPPGPKHELRYKFQPGEIVRTKVLQQVVLDTTISGSTQTAETTSGSVKVWRITQVEPDGSITFEHSVESVEMRQKVSGREAITYNSKTDNEPPPQYEGVAKSVGVPLTVVTIDPSGKILKRVEKRASATGEQQNNQMVIPLPAQPTAVGESWNVPVDVTIGLEDGVTKVIKTRQHYTLEKVSNGVATISVATQVLTPVNNPKIQSQLIQRLTKGSIRFDIDAGRVLSQDIDLDEQVLGFQGPESNLHFLGRFTEEYIPPETKSAAKPKTTK